MTANTESAEFTAETYCVIGTGETGWSVKHGDDTVCDVYGPQDYQKVMAEKITGFLNGTESSGLKRLIVEYVEDHGDSDSVEYFACWAENNDHAKEQCENAYPSCKVTAIFGVIHSYKD